MAIGWQDLAAMGAVAAALAYLARLGYVAVSGRGGKAGGCGSGCGSCPVGSASRAGAQGKGGPLVSIGPPRIPPRRG